MKKTKTQKEKDKRMIRKREDEYFKEFVEKLNTLKFPEDSLIQSVLPTLHEIYIDTFVDSKPADDDFVSSCNVEDEEFFYFHQHYISPSDFDYVCYFHSIRLIENVLHDHTYTRFLGLYPCFRCSFFNYCHVPICVFHLCSPFGYAMSKTFCRSVGSTRIWETKSIWHRDAKEQQQMQSNSFFTFFISWIPEEVMNDIYLLI